MEFLPDTVNRIAYIDRDGQLSTTAPNGSDQRRLTDDGRFYQFPAWSPDSRQIAVIGGDRRSAGIVLAGDDASSGHTVYNGEDGAPIYLYWTPDGEEISFIAAEGDSFGLYFADRGGQRRLLARGQPFFWSFAPDGRTLLAHTDGSGELGQLRLLDRAGPAYTPLVTPGLFQTPAIAASGKWAYAALEPRNGPQLHVRDPHSTVTTGIDHNGVVAFAWSPQADMLAFIHPSEQSAHWYGPLQLLDTASGEIALLVDEPVLAFFWAPDGRALAYLTVARPLDISRAGDFPATYQLAQAAGDRAPASTGRRLVLSIGIVEIDDRAPHQIGRFEPQPLFINQFLPFFDQYSRSHQIWSPDARALVLPVMSRGQSQIAVVPRNGDRAQIIAEGSMAFWSTR